MRGNKKLLYGQWAGRAGGLSALSLNKGQPLGAKLIALLITPTTSGAQKSNQKSRLEQERILLKGRAASGDKSSTACLDSRDPPTNPIEVVKFVDMF